MKVLVIGGTGLVGNALVRAWAAKGDEVVGATFHCHPSAAFRRLDIRDEAAVRALLGELKPQTVALPAANPHVDYCELHPEETREVNVAGPAKTARACADAGIPLVYFSSDYVFDGRTGDYKEEDPTSPLSEYGRQKVEAERAVLAASGANLVIRTAGAYGWQWEPKNFVLQVRARLMKGERVQAAGDMTYNPTNVENLADVVCELAAGRRAGIYHVVGADTVSKHAFAAAVAREFGLDASRVDAVPAASFKAPALRPMRSALSTTKACAAVKTPLWGLAEGLSRMRAQEPAWREYARTLPTA